MKPAVSSQQRPCSLHVEGGEAEKLTPVLVHVHSGRTGQGLLLFSSVQRGKSRFREAKRLVQNTQLEGGPDRAG